MKHLFLFLICQLSFAFTAWGNPAEIPPAVMFKQLSTTEGLSNNSVRSIFRDSRGFLWIGTESGLNKYDGYSFRQYHRDNSELPDDAIINIFEGPEMNVWIRTSNGYSIYDYKTGKFDNDYKTTLEKLKIPSKNILRIGKTPKNEFWAYDHSKIYILNIDNNSLKAYPLSIEKISNISIGVQYIYVMYSNGVLYTSKPPKPGKSPSRPFTNHYWKTMNRTSIQTKVKAYGYIHTKTVCYCTKATLHNNGKTSA